MHLSRQKFSSHVVEKCLAVFSDENRSRVIRELLSAPHFEHLLQDPHANYVVQSALRYSEVCNTTTLFSFSLLSNPQQNNQFNLNIFSGCYLFAKSLCHILECCYLFNSYFVYMQEVHIIFIIMLLPLLNFHQ